MGLKKNLPYKNLTEKETIRRILAGEKNLYENIIRKYDQRLYRISMSLVNDSKEAQDIIQTSYIKAYENLSKFQFKSELGTWLIKIVINESLLRIRKTKHSEQIIERQSKSLSNAQSPLQKIIMKEATNILEKALAQLPAKYRIVFIMREVEDMSIKETMEALKISESNVKIRLNRAKEMLRNLLARYYKTKDLFDFEEPRCDEVVENVLNYIKI